MKKPSDYGISDETNPHIAMALAQLMSGGSSSIAASAATCGLFGSPCQRLGTRPCTHQSKLVSSGCSMSALPPRADIRHRIEHVCFVPKADIKVACPSTKAPDRGWAREPCVLRAVFWGIDFGLAIPRPKWTRVL